MNRDELHEEILDQILILSQVGVPSQTTLAQVLWWVTSYIVDEHDLFAMSDEALLERVQQLVAENTGATE